MPLAAFAIGAALALLVLRVALAINNHLAARRRTHIRTMIVLGSGGHTAEMLALLQGFNFATYQPRCYVVAATDGMSGSKAAACEAALAAAAAADEEAPSSALKARTPSKQAPAAADGSTAAAATTEAAAPVRRSPRVKAAAAAARTKPGPGGGGRPPPPSFRKALPGLRSPDSPAKRRQAAAAAAKRYSQQQRPHVPELPYFVVGIPRSREVGQSFLSSVPTTLRALWAAVAVVLDHQPDLVLLNGPGTCIPIAASARLLRLLGVGNARVVYVESIARVYRLSLSGKLLYHLRLADTFFVQWEELRQRHPRAVYAGRLM